MKSYSFVIYGAFGHESFSVGSKKHLVDALRLVSDLARPENTDDMLTHFADCAWRKRKDPDSAAIAELWSESLGTWSLVALRQDIDSSHKVRERLRVYSCKKHSEHVVRYGSEPAWRRANAELVASFPGG